jgi:hypothetical protein
VAAGSLDAFLSDRWKLSTQQPVQAVDNELTVHNLTGNVEGLKAQLAALTKSEQPTSNATASLEAKLSVLDSRVAKVEATSGCGQFGAGTQPRDGNSPRISIVAVSRPLLCRPGLDRLNDLLGHPNQRVGLHTRQ